MLLSCSKKGLTLTHPVVRNPFILGGCPIFFLLQRWILGRMGNAIRFLYRCCRPEEPPPGPPPARPDRPLGPHGVTQATVGVSALARDLFNFEIGSQVAHCRLSDPWERTTAPEQKFSIFLVCRFRMASASTSSPPRRPNLIGNEIHPSPPSPIMAAVLISLFFFSFCFIFCFFFFFLFFFHPCSGLYRFCSWPVA